MTHAVFSLEEELLTWTGDIVWQWKEELPNPAITSSAKETEFEDLGENSLAEVAEAVKKFLGSKAPGVDEICHEVLKALNIIRLS